MCFVQMAVTKKEKYKDANSNNNSNKKDQDNIAVFMEKVEEIARVANKVHWSGPPKIWDPIFYFIFLHIINVEKGVYTNNAKIVVKNT